ncbi:zwei Ig domain protein zig-8-like [Zerene cesonia]|uniref:zwei Ig domain protein zig-8-like n=1 Tax=Zerene cesonia TaxID=33412 RepID=UPI0018E50333|nr:zwei Ig domain protein zig-8-like [Zerene cesonia]
MREPAKRVGCGGMRRALFFMALLTRAVGGPTPQLTEAPSTEAYTTKNLLETVFRRPTTAKPRPGSRRKGDSPMLNYIFDSYATSNKHFHDKFKAPSFEGDLNSDTIINADTGSTVVFDCKVSSLRDKTVSWLRVSDDENLELLTLNLDTYTADARYRVDLAGENWKLSLAYAKIQDSGIYCCHVSTHPPMLRRFKLIVHAPEIRMSKETFLETGETLSLKCSVLHLNPGEVTPELFWYRGNNSTPLDEVRGGVLVETDQLTLTSHLQVARLKLDDAGNYTCALESPIQMKAVTRVHVLQGSSLAELQSGVKTTTSYISLLLASLLIILARYGDVR